MTANEVTETQLVPAATRAVTPAKPPEPRYFQGFEGAASAPFDDCARLVLAEPVDPRDVEIRPDGIVYLSGVWYRRQLTRAFGAGGWALVPRGSPQKMGEMVVYHGVLVVLGRFASEAMGECETRSGMSYASALEGARTDCITRCCKDLGMASELWDRTWREEWKAKHAYTEGTDNRGKPKWWKNDGAEHPMVPLFVAPPGASASKAAPPVAAPPALVTPGVTSREGAAAERSDPGQVPAVGLSAPPPPRETSDPKGSAPPAGATGIGNGSAAQAQTRTTGEAQQKNLDTSQATSKRRDSGAKDIKHDGNLCSSGQVTKLHVLRAKSPSLSATPDDPRSNWKKKLAPYKRQDGTPCQHSNELSMVQARHLIDWMQAKVDALEAKEREIREGTDGTADNLVAFVAPEKVTPADLLEKLHAVFVSALEEDEWLGSLGFRGGADSVPEESRHIVCQLAAAWKAGPEVSATYRELLTKAEALGHVRT